MSAACGGEDSRPAQAPDSSPPDVSIPDASVAAPSHSLAVVVPLDADVRRTTDASGRDSCAVYGQERCVSGAKQVCALYDEGASQFTDAPDPLALRAYQFDRWYDLYHQPSGQTANRVLSQDTLTTTPESEWGAPERFSRYSSLGDSAIWTGTALNAASLRYLATGSAADYDRMTAKASDLLFMFDVTDIPGYLARYHFLLLDNSGPTTDNIAVEYGTRARYNYQYHDIASSTLPRAPRAYVEGVADSRGKIWKGTPLWRGNPSIDQYSGPLAAFPLAYGLIRDQSLRDRIVHHVTCYLKRLVRIEVRNLTQNAEAQASLSSFLSGGQLEMEAGDPDLSKIDTVVAYGLLQPNSQNQATFDRSCPATVPREARIVLDAADSSFTIGLIGLALDLQSGSQERPSGIDHAYFVNVRGGDAVHMLQLAAFAYLATGDEQYRLFFERDLIGELRVLDTVRTLGSLRVPKWCRTYYAEHITFPTFWSLLTMLRDGELRTELAQSFLHELGERTMADDRNTKFELMLAGTLPAFMSRDAMLQRSLSALDELGGNGGLLNDPRRKYRLDPGLVVAELPAGTVVSCPTETERKACEDGVTLFGVSVPGTTITRACSGAVAECALGDLCADGLSSIGLPPRLRGYEDFMWQRNPYKLGRSSSQFNREQAPGLDVTEPYWLARAHGLIDAGAGQTLAWKNDGQCEQ